MAGGLALRRYLYFANKADVEGHTDVAALFRTTMLIEYADEQERRVALTKLKGIERKTWVQVEGAKKVYAIADEDLERENETKTSAVHFMRVPLSEEMAAALKCGVTLRMGVDHPEYTHAVDISIETRNALVKDLR